MVGHLRLLALDGDMPNFNDVKRRIVHTVQRHVANPVGRQLPVTMLETIGRKSGEPRHTAIGGRVIDGAFWLVSEHGDHADFVRNIKANPAVRVRINGEWRTGTAHPMPDDDPVARLRKLPQMNSAVVRMMGTDLLSVRVDLD
ncbi:deazaflavin-dependent oxidoreductase (nitroreductase family) [Mycobacterium sp. OTB74]|nr:deazaflavin-dependent oxidoreductase (nitroreductase family) [Mycobacterium sp. OTB74]